MYPIFVRRPVRTGFLIGAALLSSSALRAGPPDGYLPAKDWLLDASGFKATVTHDEKSGSLVLGNGLVRRTIALTPAAATTGLENLMTGSTLLRAVSPEAVVTIDDVEYSVGGVSGKTNRAFLPSDTASLKAADNAFRFEKMETGPITAHLEWKRVRQLSNAVEWPPKGRHVRLDFVAPGAKDGAAAKTSSRDGRRVLAEDAFASLQADWKEHRSPASERSSFVNEGKVGEIYTPANTSCYAERALPAGTRLVEAQVFAGTDTSETHAPGIALVFKDGRVLKFAVSAAKSAFVADGKLTPVRADLSKNRLLRIRLDDGVAHCEAREENGAAWIPVADVPVPAGDPLSLRLGKTDANGGGTDDAAPGELSRLKVDGFLACSAPVETPRKSAEGVVVSVHYNIYDGVPLISKWITVTNTGGRKVTLTRFALEKLALVEGESSVDTRDADRFRESAEMRKPDLYVETDYAMGGMDRVSSAWSVHWDKDPAYTSQVNYGLNTPCLLDVGTRIGPDKDLAPGETFESFRAYELAPDTTERERATLERRRMYRVIAPWTQENPLMMHARFSAPAKVREAIDQASAVGFETLILSFGSGFDIENEKPEYLAGMKALADYAKSKGVEIGGYTLLSSRRIGGGNDNVPPKDLPAAHGNSPSLVSKWGLEYIRKVNAFFDKSGFTLLEHDGPYPGDFDTTARPPYQKGLSDSQYVQWKISADLYSRCLANGIYVNQPDHYFLRGGNKTGMGYREVNWSLPRAEQRILCRQNIFDGTWEKTPTMGWMFVPLTQYQGGGAAATIEPLSQNLDHYESMLASNLLLGVQACYRGPRLYDTDTTKAAVKKWVDLYKRHRAILDSDLLHLRRADGKDLDYMLHVNPELKEKGLLAVFNPTDRTIRKEIVVPLYLTGLAGSATLTVNDGEAARVALDENRRARITVEVPANAAQWIVFTATP